MQSYMVGGVLCRREKPCDTLKELTWQVPYSNEYHVSSRYDWVQGALDRAKERLLLEVRVETDTRQVPSKAGDQVLEIPLCKHRNAVVEELDRARQSTHLIHKKLDPMGRGGGGGLEVRVTFGVKKR